MSVRRCPPWPARMPDGAERISVLDMHTAGEPVRIVLNGYPELEGQRLLDRRRYAATRHDRFRRRLMLEPRGHAGMYGVIPLAPCRPDAALSVLFTHAGGYSTMCGHATLAIARWAVESGVVTATPPVTRFGLECPCGLVQAFVRHEGDRFVEAGFDSVAAFVDSPNLRVRTASFGAVEFAVAFGGAYYAILPASTLGLDFDRNPHTERVAAAAALFREILSVPLRRVDDPDMRFLYGVILTDGAPWPEPTRNLCVFGEGQVDRSPTGSGVTARLALDVLRDGVPLGAPRRFSGPTGADFLGEALCEVDLGGERAIVARIRGTTAYCGLSDFIVEPGDELADGFLLTDAET